jgi:hypothetical protein
LSLVKCILANAGKTWFHYPGQQKHGQAVGFARGTLNAGHGLCLT